MLNTHPAVTSDVWNEEVMSGNATEMALIEIEDNNISRWMEMYMK